MCDNSEVAVSMIKSVNDRNGPSEIISTKTSPTSIKPPRNKPLTSPVLSIDDITKEFLERVEKKRAHCPDGLDVCLAMTSPSQVRLPTLEPPGSITPLPKLPKLRDPNKPSLDATELLSILEGGAETHYTQKLKPKIRSRGSRDLKIDPELEKSLALKQLMEFSPKRGRPRKEPENNNNNIPRSREKPKKKEVKRGANRELQKLLQDEGAINMLYSVEKGEPETKDRLLSSKRRQKKVLLKKAQEVEEALLGATSTTGVMLRHRTADKRKPSVESVDSEHSARDFEFPFPAEASKILRRHSSSSSYSSRGSSPHRSNLDFDRSPCGTRSPVGGDSSVVIVHNQEDVKVSSPMKMSERAEKLIEMKCKELNLQPEHSNIIKKLIQDKKNGIRERLQSEFKNKFKAAVKASPLIVSVRKEIRKTLDSAGPSSTKAEIEIPKKPIWKTVVEDWDTWTMDESDQENRPVTQKQETTLSVSDSVHTNGVTRKNEEDTRKNVLKLESLANRCKDLTIEKVDQILHLNIAPTSTHLPQALNAKVMSELCLALDHAAENSSVRVVVLTCTGNVFCNGVDLPSLLVEDKENRRMIAAETAIALKEFVCKLSMMGKPVLVAVSGQTVGLGVVMLAYCDYVLSDETSTFFTPYPKLGCLPEGAATLALPYVVGHRMASSLLLGCTRLTSAEAKHCGLVTKVIPKEELFETIMKVAQSMAKQSIKTMESTKALLMHTMRTRLLNTLNTEVRLLEQTWSSDECQSRIKDLESNPIF